MAVLARGLDGQYTQHPTKETQSSSADKTETKEQNEADPSALGSESQVTLGDVSGGTDHGMRLQLTGA